MRKRRKDRTLIGSGYVDEATMYSLRGFPGEMRRDRAHVVDFGNASQTQYWNPACMRASLRRQDLQPLRIFGLKPYHKLPPPHFTTTPRLSEINFGLVKGWHGLCIDCIVALLPNTDDAGALCFARAIGWVVANWCEASSWSMHRTSSVRNMYEVRDVRHVVRQYYLFALPTLLWKS
jgi:hypothetical protein